MHEEIASAQVSALETVISKGGKVVDKDVVKLIELLMNQLLKLDAIVADGDVKLQRKMQVLYYLKMSLLNGPILNTTSGSCLGDESTEVCRET